MDNSQSTLRAAEGYGLTTAQIIYRIPDRLALLQEFIWQEFDSFPEFPELCRFLRFWQDRIEGPLHSVTVAHHGLIRPTELDMLGSGDYRLH